MYFNVQTKFTPNATPSFIILRDAVKSPWGHCHSENTIPCLRAAASRIWPLGEPRVGRALGWRLETNMWYKVEIGKHWGRTNISHFLGLSDPTPKLALPKNPHRYEALFNTIVCFSGQTSVLSANDFIITLFMYEKYYGIHEIWNMIQRVGKKFYSWHSCRTELRKRVKYCKLAVLRNHEIKNMENLHQSCWKISPMPINYVFVKKCYIPYQV